MREARQSSSSSSMRTALAIATVAVAVVAALYVCDCRDLWQFQVAKIDNGKYIIQARHVIYQTMWHDLAWEYDKVDDAKAGIEYLKQPKPKVVEVVE